MDQNVSNAGVVQDEKLWTANFVKIIIINILLFSSFHMLVPTFPLYIRHLGGTDIIVGVAAGLFSIAGMTSRLFTGWILDNKSRKIPFIIGLVIMIICPVVFIFITPMIWILVFRFIQGLGFSMGNTSTATNSSDILPKNHFSEGLGIFGISSTISLSVSPAFGLFISETLGFHMLFFFSFLLASISFILALKFKTKHIVITSKKRFNIKTDVINLSAIPASLAMFFAITPYGAINNFVALYAIEKGFNNYGQFFIFLALSSMVFRILTGKIIDKKSLNLMYFIAIPSFILSLITLALTNNEILFLLSAILFGVGFGATMPVLLTKALKRIPLEKRGSANSTFFLSFDLGIGLGGLIAGALSDIIGYSNMYLSILVLYVFSALVYMFFLYEKKTIPIEAK